MHVYARSIHHSSINLEMLMIINSLKAARQIAFVSVAVTASTLCMLSASAANRTDNDISMTVKYGDLDLTTTDGIHALYRRLVLASQKVCPGDLNLDLQNRSEILACRANAVTHAVQVINNSKLAAVHEQSTRHGQSS
jgi:UrcA family protein